MTRSSTSGPPAAPAALTSSWRMRHQDPGISCRLRVNANDRLAVEIPGDVSDQPVLADHDNNVTRVEAPSGQIGALDRAAPPDGGYGSRDRADRRLDRAVALLGVVDRAAPRVQEECR